MASSIQHCSSWQNLGFAWPQQSHIVGIGHNQTLLLLLGCAKVINPLQVSSLKQNSCAVTSCGSVSYAIVEQDALSTSLRLIILDGLFLFRHWSFLSCPCGQLKKLMLSPCGKLRSSLTISCVMQKMILCLCNQ